VVGVSNSTSTGSFMSRKKESTDDELETPTTEDRTLPLQSTLRKNSKITLLLVGSIRFAEGLFKRRQSSVIENLTSSLVDISKKGEQIKIDFIS
jgi:hypothetical protein